MPFDQNPADDYEHYQCSVCGGSIRLNEEKTMWECDTCDLQHVIFKEINTTNEQKITSNTTCNTVAKNLKII